MLFKTNLLFLYYKNHSTIKIIKYIYIIFILNFISKKKWVPQNLKPIMIHLIHHHTI